MGARTRPMRGHDSDDNGPLDAGSTEATSQPELRVSTSDSHVMKMADEGPQPAISPGVAQAPLLSFAGDQTASGKRGAQRAIEASMTLIAHSCTNVMPIDRLPPAARQLATPNTPLADAASSTERPRSAAHASPAGSGWLDALKSCCCAGPRRLGRPDPVAEFAASSTATDLRPPREGIAQAFRPRATLPGHPASTAHGVSYESAEQREAIEKLTEIRQRFSALLAANWAPDKIDIEFDKLVLPFAVAAENARTPGLNLTLLAKSGDLKGWLADAACPAEGKRAIFQLPVPGEHVVAVDVRRRDGRTSMLLIEPPTADNDHVEGFDSYLLPALEKLIPLGTTLTMLALGTQKANSGCHVFALSAASKLADQRVALDVLHDRNLNGQPLKTQLGRNAGQLAGNNRIRLLDGTGVLPAGFVKHSQSGTTLQKWLDASPPELADEMVNRKGMTLHARHGAHATTRYSQLSLESRLKEEEGKSGGALAHSLAPKRTSTSIEMKRLTYIDRAIDHLRQAPPSVSREFLEELGVLEFLGHSAQELDLNGREWGPRPT